MEVAKKRILLVDDTYCNRFLTQKILTKAGFAVIEADCGQAGLERALEIPDLIILDVNLPDISGFEVCRRLREMPRTKMLPILHLSADHADSQSKIRGLEGGADGYLAQPVEAGVLIATIKALLRAKAAEDALRKSEEQFRAVFDSAGIGMLIVEAAGTIVKANPSCGGLMKSPPGAMQGTSFFEWLHPEHREANRRMWAEALAGHATSGRSFLESRYSRTDGGFFWGRQTISPMKKGDEIDGLVVMIEDITLQKNAEHEKASLQQQLMQSQKMEAIGTLAGGVAHDFNNILTAIQGYCDLALLKSYDQDNNPHEDLQEIKIAADRAAALTQQLLVFSRKESFQPAVLDLNKHIQSFQKMLSRIIGEDVAIRLELAEDLNPICADGGNIDQIIMNLAVNSRKAMPLGGSLLIKTETVPKKPECVEMADLPEGSYVCLSVTDTGTGIPPEILTRIFEPFFTTREVGQGTGLGLSVVYGIVRRHEGAIRVESELGRGATFRVYFPAYSESVAQRFRIERNKQVGSRTGGRILVVEDEESIGNLLATILPKNGFVVSVARTKKRAFEIFSEKKGAFDLALCDVVFPDGNGIELIDEFQRINPVVQILMSSGYADNASGRLQIEERKIRFIPKPYHIADLLEVIEGMLR